MKQKLKYIYLNSTNTLYYNCGHNCALNTQWRRKKSGQQRHNDATSPLPSSLPLLSSPTWLPALFGSQFKGGKAEKRGQEKAGEGSTASGIWGIDAR